MDLIAILKRLPVLFVFVSSFFSSSFRLPASRLGTVERYTVVESNAGFDGDNIRYQGLADRNARGAQVYQGMSA